MKLTNLNTAIVVLAESHNPTILHPSFLAAQGIVPSDWQLAEPPVCTPAISVVKYANGVIFTAEINKFMVLENAPRPTNLIPEVASKYIETLPHVHYTAVGLNVSAYIDRPDPEVWLRERFLKSVPGNDEKLRPNAVGFKFVYSVELGVLNLSCDISEIQRSAEQTGRACILVSGNYHVALSGENPLEQARAAISLYPKRLAHFDEITQTIFGLEPS